MQHYDEHDAQDITASLQSHGEKTRQLQRPNITFLEPRFNNNNVDYFESHEENDFPTIKEPKHVEELKVAIQEEIAWWGIHRYKSVNHAKFEKKQPMLQLHHSEVVQKYYWSPLNTSLNVPLDLSDIIRLFLSLY